MNTTRYLLLTAAAALAVAAAPAQVQAQNGNGPVNIVVRISWDHAADLDLHVYEPWKQGREQHCYYGRRRTDNGGTLDHDTRRGPGSEQYTMRGGPAGRYKVEVTVFNFNGTPNPATFRIEVIENGRVTVDQRISTVNTATFNYELR